ncbi:MAG: DUF4407 domain-containing protein [Bacteroidetes bacterium]|nr:DUF4407 domain-containing protein [Bacteroidota bacterium]
MKNLILKLQCIITGDEHRNVVNETPESIKKIKLSAMVIFIPVFIWTVQGFLILTQLIRTSILQAIAGTIIISALIFTVERAILMMKGGKGIFGARIFLGILIALIGALTMDEIIFRTDVDRQLEENNRRYAEEEIRKWESENMNKINLQKETADNYAQKKDDAMKIYLEEINGTGGTGRRGVDIVAKEKYKIYSEAGDDYAAEKLKLERMNSDYENEKNLFRSKLENSASFGLLHRIEALFDLISKNTVMAVFMTIFTLIFLILDLMVVIVKIFSARTNYERKNEEIELIGASRMKRMRDRDALHFNPSELHPDGVRMKKNLKENLPKIF